MRILFLGKYFPPHQGGIERYTYDLARKLKEKKHDIWVLVSNKSKFQNYEKKFQNYENIDGIKLIRLPMLLYFIRGFLTPPIFSWIKKINPDIIHLQVPNPWFELNTLIYYLFGDKKKLIITYHSDILDYTIAHRFFNFFRKFMLFPLLKIYTCKIIATSPDYVKSSQFLWYSRDKVEVMPLSLDLSLFYPSILKDKKQKKIFFVGRLATYKGLEYLLMATHLVSKKRNDFKIVIIGDGPLKYKLKHMTKELFIEEFVDFKGSVSDKELMTLLKEECDIFVLPSIYRSEAFGISMMEAMALGKPVISTKIKGSGVNFVNINNLTGLVVEPKNSKQLADAIIKLLDNPDLRKKLGMAGRKRVEENFDLDKYIKRLISLYSDCISKK